MSLSIDVRAFRRGDREQVTHLVNAHVAAVIPGMSVSVNTVLSQLEREPAEFIVDPWVIARATLVAEQRGRVVAAAHLLESHRRHGIGTWLVGHAAEWLQLARLDRVLDYSRPEEPDYQAFLQRVGFRELTRTTRGWRRPIGG